MKHFDLAILGAGPGGYVAAIHAAELGLNVALIEKDFLGGVCLNYGCIPTKTLLQHAHILRTVKKASFYGIETDKISFDFEKIHKQKNQTVATIRKNLENLLKSHSHITLLHGEGSFVSDHELLVKGPNNSESLQADTILLATGSSPKKIASFPSIDGERIHDSTTILNLSKLPSSLTIIGGGYIGCEFASLFSSFGVKISLIEAESSLIPTQEKILSEELKKSFVKQGIDLHLSTSVSHIEKTQRSVSLSLSSGNTIASDMLLIATGRTCSFDSLKLENLSTPLAKNHCFLQINESMQTTLPHIYAIGDMTGVCMLAHVASHQGILAAKHIAKKTIPQKPLLIPSVVFTHPEIASVGLTSKQACEQNIPFQTSVFPFRAIGKAIALQETEGFVQLLYETSTKKILGAHVIGISSSTLIAEMTLAIEKNLSLEEFCHIIHAHPTLSESWMEAAFLATGFPIHLPPKKTLSP